MTTPGEQELTGLHDHWKTLKTQAENGELRMDPQIGNALKGRADTMLTALNKMLVDTNQLQHVSGFGTLKSAEALRGSSPLKRRPTTILH